MTHLPNLIEKDRSLWQVIKFVFVESIRGSKKYSTMRYITAAIGSAFAFIEFGAIAIIINEFATRGIDGARIAVIIGGFILLALSDFLPAIVSSFNNYYWSVQTNEMERHLQTLQLLKMRELDIGTVEQAEFQNILENSNSRGWNSFYSTINILTNSIRYIISLIISTLSLVVISPFILLVILAGSLPTFFLQRQNSRLSAQIWKENAEKWRMWRAKTNPAYGKHSLIELKNFNLVKVFLNKFLETISAFHELTRKLSQRTVKNDIISRIALTIAFGGAFALLIQGVYAGAIAIGALVFSFSVVARFQMALNGLFDGFGRLAEHKKNLDTFIDLLEMKPLIVSGTKKLDPDEPIHLELNHITFSYPGTDRKVLDNISLSIQQGDNLAIVGLNGAGKTTLIKLLTRVYDPTSGQILINGIPLPEYDLKDWKKKLGILLQEYSLYSEESVAENIMLGDITKHDRGLVEKVAQESTIAEFIETLPQKYDQKVGTEFRGGVEFSKGQKQKIALARVLYREAPFVILDEPTASVDAVSEDTIFKNLKNNHRNQTRVIISHKFSNVRDADQIILIEHGKIIEQGTHDELMQNAKGKYRELFELQAEGYK